MDYLNRKNMLDFLCKNFNEWDDVQEYFGDTKFNSRNGWNMRYTTSKGVFSFMYLDNAKMLYKPITIQDFIIEKNSTIAFNDIKK